MEKKHCIKIESKEKELGNMHLLQVTKKVTLRILVIKYRLKEVVCCGAMLSLDRLIELSQLNM